MTPRERERCAHGYTTEASDEHWTFYGAPTEICMDRERERLATVLTFPDRRRRIRVRGVLFILSAVLMVWLVLHG